MLYYKEQNHYTTSQKKSKRAQQAAVDPTLKVDCGVVVVKILFRHQYHHSTRRMTDDIPAIPLSPSGRRLNIPLANPAEEERDVFIPLNKTVAALRALIAQAEDEGENVVFIRAPVASGKTTLANYLRKKHSDKFVYVDFATSEDQWYQHVIDASGEENLSFLQVRKALKTSRNKRRLL